tara:strand:- start:171 stop:584 length:414 start_codon:yes stop_codon:yes gene_type:complete
MYLDLTNSIDVKKYENYSHKLKDGKFKVELRKIIPKRTLNLNKYLHVCIDIFAIEFGYTSKESKTYLKRSCNFMLYEKNGSKFLKETSKMDNKECSEFVGWIRNYSADKGCYIPDADEYKANQFNIDKEINKHKQYL